MRTTSSELSVTRTTPYDELPSELTLHEAASRLGYCYWTTYQMVKRNELPHRRIGKRYFVPKEFFRSGTTSEPAKPHNSGMTTTL